MPTFITKDEDVIVMPIHKAVPSCFILRLLAVARAAPFTRKTRAISGSSRSLKFGAKSPQPCIQLIYVVKLPLGSTEDEDGK